MCEISVIMAAYNSQATIAEAIESVLNQSFSDFELIIVDDGSEDLTGRIVCSYKDDRIRYMANPRNYGLPESLNRGIACACGKYIARMDADDIMTADRLKTQMEFLLRHPDISLVGSDYMIFRGNTDIKRMCMPVMDDEIRGELLNHSPFCHPSIIARKEVFKRFSYNAGFRYCQDYELWSRVLTEYKAANIPKVLLRYRLSDSSNTAISNKKSDERKGFIRTVYRRILLQQLSLKEGDYDENLQFILGSSSNISTAYIAGFSPRRVEDFLDKLVKANRQSKYCSEHGMKMMIGKVWLKYLIFNFTKLKLRERAKMVLNSKFIWGIKFMTRQYYIHK